MSVVELNCIFAGLTCAVIAGINRDLNLDVNQAAKRHGQRLEQQVKTLEADRNKLKTVSANLLYSKKQLDDQLALEKLSQIRLNQAHEQLEQFSLAASHDLKEPIRTIRLYTQLVQKRLPPQLKQDAGLKEQFQFITNSCKHMHAALEKLLVYQRVSHAEEKITELCLTNIWNQQLLRASKDLYSVLEKESPIDLNAITRLDKFMQSVAKRVTVDTSSTNVGCIRLKMTRQNADILCYEIAHNALLFRHWDKDIEIEFDKVSRTQSILSIKITDNGIGIEDLYTERVFGMFKRLHHREKFSGTGLGLPIARRIVTRAEGNIKVEPSKVEGTTVRIELPIFTSA